MIVTSMDSSAYNFKRCKLCREIAAEPAYDLGDSTIYVCRNCDFHFLSQLDCLSEKTTEEGQLNETSRRYIESRMDENSPLLQNRLNFVKRQLDLSQCKTLDIGAGLGQFQLLLNGCGAKVKGIEPSSLRRAYALEKFAVNLHSELVDHDYWQTGFVQYFDLITLWDVIEHVDFPRETLESAFKLLKPGGMLFLDTPSREVLSYQLSQQLYRFSAGKISLFLPSFYSTVRYGHKQIFTQQQLSGLIESCGLGIVFSTDSDTNKLFSSHKIILAGRKTEPTPAETKPSTVRH
ncbi:MAG: class I SAM-dependent methyltransferase [Desulfuromusa sp.]|jgi:SAM-dependent methyltransferase|nr:class I SAM-dependent methyltransferase [Desulfuromusa sp.]